MYLKKNYVCYENEECRKWRTSLSLSISSIQYVGVIKLSVVGGYFRASCSVSLCQFRCSLYANRAEHCSKPKI